MARALAALFALAASLSFLSLLVPHGPDINLVQAVSTAALAYPFAGALVLAGGRVPRWAIHVFLACGTVMIAVGTHSAGNGRTAGSASVFFLWVAIYAGYFFAWPAVALHLGFVFVSYAAVLLIQHEQAGPALLIGMTGTVTATAAVIGSLAGRLRALASTDPLTGLPNRRGWERALERELSRAKRRSTPLCVAVLDLDHFKEFNDEQGHLAGDRLLREVAATWLGLLRDTDVLARYGGDEFGIILPDCYPNKANEIVSRLCESTAGGSTCSAGMAVASDDVDMSDLIGRADQALYRAKGAGGNQAVFAEAPPPLAG
ncbi:MAG: diguanylate cyclase [Actinomycetota bacterium]|jgi:diguanylate cyclase (GGDEF)-like protein